MYCMYIHTNVNLHMYVRTVHVYARIYVHTYVHVCSTCIHMYIRTYTVRTYICMYVSMYCMYVCVCIAHSIHSYICMYVYVLVSWCGGELWVDQRKVCADICDVAQFTDIRTHTS